jgi:hypothetical protein
MRVSQRNVPYAANKKANQSTDAEPAFLLSRETGRNQRTYQRPNSPGTHQQAHAEQSRALRTKALDWKLEHPHRHYRK